jgi:hypothetical protein
VKYIHIGLGKTGTTFLQEEIFPKISNLNGLNYYNKVISENIINLDNYFLSNENLVGEFFSSTSWEDSLKRNLEKFGSDINIILTIREPLEYFASVFCQGYHAYNIVKEEEFFLNNSMSDAYIKKNNYYFINYEKFCYPELINLYKKNFQNVYIIKYEDIKNLSIWSKIFNNNDIKKIKINNIHKNRSYSNAAIKLTLIFEKFLRLINTNLFNLQNKVRKINQIKFLPNRIKNKLSYELRWRFFIQNRFDKLIPYKKYNISNKNIKKKIIEKDNGFYENFVSSHYNKNFSKELL